MDLLEAIRTRQSVRGLEPVDIPAEDLETIVDAGRLAPSGKNTQPWEFLVITEGETIATLAEVQSLLGQASAIVAIVADEHASPYWLEDASAAAENMLLAVHGLGYGSRWIEGTLKPAEARVKALLGIPAEKRLVIMLPVGRPVFGDQPKSKKSLDEVIHWNRYEQKKA